MNVPVANAVFVCCR